MGRTAGFWSSFEVEATVADYFAMLEHHLRGEPYNKSSHRRALKNLLNNRSDGAIERKHQNISAILIALGFVYIPGYKPLGNYQGLLYDVVTERIQSDAGIRESAMQHVSAEALIPEFDDILNVMTDPPSPSPLASLAVRTRLPRKFNYLAIEAANRSLGGAGEEFVIRFEMARLRASGRDALASRVERVSQTQGDGLGFDVKSYEADGRDRLIEVKTTAYGAATPFYVTPNELAVSAERSDVYHVYRAFDFRRSPQLFVKAGAIDQSFRLHPSQYQARIG